MQRTLIGIITMAALATTPSFARGSRTTGAAVGPVPPIVAALGRELLEARHSGLHRSPPDAELVASNSASCCRPATSIH